MSGGTDVTSPRFTGQYYVGGQLFEDGKPVVQVGGYSVITGQVAGVSDNDLCYTSGDVSDFAVTVIEAVTGTVDLEVTLDGTYWNTTPPAVLLHDATASGTYSTTIAAGKIGILKGRYKGVRVRQNGATAATIRGAHIG